MPGTVVTILISAVICIAIPAVILYLIISRGLQMKELCDQGVETVGTVTSKRRSTASQGKTERLSYQYTDSNGGTHSHTSIVSLTAYREHEEGQPIRVVYSAKRPQISAPLYLVEQSRKALGRA